MEFSRERRGWYGCHWATLGSTWHVSNKIYKKNCGRLVSLAELVFWRSTGSGGDGMGGIGRHVTSHGTFLIRSTKRIISVFWSASAEPEIWSSAGTGCEALWASARLVASNGPFRVSFTFRISVVLGSRRIREFGVQRGHRKAVSGVLAGFWPQAVRFGWSSRLEFRSLWTFGGSGNSGFNGDLCKRSGGLWTACGIKWSVSGEFHV